MKKFGAVAQMSVGLALALSTAWADDALAPRETALRATEGTRGAGTGLGRPILGYVAQSSPPELRAILGVPGAAIFSEPLLIPSDTTSVRLAPGRGWGWIERGTANPAVLRLSGTRAGNATGLAGVLPVADLAAFSPAGRSLVLFSSSAGRLQVLSGLPDAPQIAQDVTLDSAAGRLPGAPDAIAVSDDAGAVLMAAGRVIHLLSPEGATRPVLNITDTAAMAFLPGSRDAAILDRGPGTIHLVRNAAGGVSSSVVSTGVLAAGLAGARDITSTSDGQGLVLTNPGATNVWTVNALTGEVRRFDTPVSPAGLQRLMNRDSYLISAEQGQPAWIFSLQGDGARTVFVPAAAPGRPRRD